MKKFVALLDGAVRAFFREVERLIDRGYVSAWFSWLEWVLVAGLLLAIGNKTGFWLLQAIGWGSAALLVFVGITAVERVKSEYITSQTGAGASTVGIALVVTGFGIAAIQVMVAALDALLSSVAAN